MMSVSDTVTARRCFSVYAFVDLSEERTPHVDDDGPGCEDGFGFMVLTERRYCT